MKSSLIIPNGEGGCITLNIVTGSVFRSDLRVWETESNTLILGSDYFDDWERLYGDVEKQRVFLSKAVKINNYELDQKNK